MDRFRALQTFLAVADQNGFAAAAEALHMSPTAVTRLVSALENQMGVRLLARTTRRVRLTEAGTLFAANARKILADLADAESMAAGVAGALRGRIRLSAPVLFGEYRVAPAILDFMRKYPEITIDLQLVDRTVDLLEEDIDVAIRLADMADSSLIAIPVGKVERVLVASPNYLARHGAPHSLADLECADGIELSTASAQQWTFLQQGRERLVRPRIVLSTTAPQVVIAAATQGLGIARLMTYQVRNEIADGRLQVLLAECETPPKPVHVIYHSRQHVTSRVRVMIDHLKATLHDDQA